MGVIGKPKREIFIPLPPSTEPVPMPVTQPEPVPHPDPVPAGA
jgi:hypothetical protein